MLKLSKYFKSFMIATLIAIAFLFIQAMCDLKLPDYMSDIVNIGIQSNGLEQVAPKAISENGFECMKKFMAEDEIQYVEERYIKGSREEEAKYIEEYPAVKTFNIYALKNDLTEEEINKLSQIFAVSSKTMINVISKISEGTENVTEASQETENIDLSQVYQMLPILDNIPEEMINQARNEARKTPESMLNSVGLVFTQSFYEEIGIDVSKMQNQFIVQTGLKMLGICVIGIIASISVGFLGSRIGAGIGRNIRNDVFQKVQNFSSAEFNNFSAASLITRTTNDITQIQNFIVMMIRMLAYAPIMGIGSLIMMSQKTTELIWTIALACGLIILLIYRK